MNMRGQSLWDSDLVAGVAFHPRRCKPSPGSVGDATWLDSYVVAGDGTKLAYRLYLPSPPRPAPEDGRPVLLMYFHANAELCTDMAPEAGRLFECGFSAVLCPEFRGYAWSEGKPRLSALAADAEAVVEAIPSILRGARLPLDMAMVIHGRSLGSICAVHLASCAAEKQLQEHGSPTIEVLIVESGIKSLVDLPMVRQLGSMMPEMLHLLMASPSPLKTGTEMEQVKIPTLVLHGELDEISPVEQGISLHRACGSSTKKLVRFPNGRHNDLRTIAGTQLFGELHKACLLAAGILSHEEMLAQEEQDGGLLQGLFGALRCLPGARRCFANADLDSEDTSVD